ncbi:MAG: nodulation protein NodH, partial [Boseongicola sp.]|nr:nodulation protein NodH [Boseongicola sp.]
MTGDFTYFVVLAGMRTGSNLLEECLTAMPGLRSHGELFNPHFFGKPDRTKQFGLSLEARDENPLKVIEAMRDGGDGLPGFRLFNDHDRRVIDHVLEDRSAAKIILTRRPIDSYVSLQIARKTGQWWLGDLASARSAKVDFHTDDYVTFLNALNDFQDKVRRSLQVTGQTAFQIDYGDLSDPEIIKGLGRFLGARGPADMTKVRAKVQNPKPLADRLSNPVEAEAALTALGAPDIGFIPSYEPDRGPGLRMFHVCRNAPLLYMPIR